MQLKRPTPIITLALVALLALLAPAVADNDAGGEKPTPKIIKVTGGQFDINEMPKEVYDAVMDKIWEDEHQDPPLETRLYDIGTLLMDVPDHQSAWLDMMPPEPDCYCSGGGGVEIFEDCCDEDEETQGERLCELIKRCIHADGPREAVWEDSGGRASIVVLENESKLAVTTTVESHVRVEAFLATLAKARPQDVTIQVMVIGFKADFARSLMLDGTYVANTAARRDALLKAIETVHDCATLSGKNGQKLTHNSGKVDHFVTDVEPVIAESSQGWDPTVTSVFEGLSVRAEATLEPGGAARVDYGLGYARTVGSGTMVLEGTSGSATAKATVEKPKIVYQRKAGTASLSLDTPTVVTGGMVPAALVAEDVDAKGKVPLYYVITVRRTTPGAKEATHKK